MYKLTLTDNQLRVVQKALESWERMSMGQFWDFADEIAMVGTDFNPEHPDHKRIFDDYIDRRDRAREKFDQAFREAQPYSQTEDGRYVDCTGYMDADKAQKMERSPRAEARICKRMLPGCSVFS